MQKIAPLVRAFGLTFDTMLSRGTLYRCIAVLTALMYTWLLVQYVAAGQVSWVTPWVVLGALYMADAGSGVAHFVVDYTPNTRGAGLKELFEYPGDKSSADYVQKRRQAMRKISGFQEVVFDFKVHHLSPETLGRRSVLTMTLPVIVFATFPLTGALVVLTLFGAIAANLTLFLMVLVAAATVAQYAHACAHKLAVPLPARVLQATRLFMPPGAHEVHHEHPDRQFCLLNGWANPVVDRLFQFLLKRGVYQVDGLNVV